VLKRYSVCVALRFHQLIFQQRKKVDWRKTVEYLFINELLRQNLDFFAHPLVPRGEGGADDLIASPAVFLYLVEFRPDVSSLDLECVRFYDYEKARLLLKGSDSHHLVAYGESTEQGITLGVRSYFSGSQYRHLLKNGRIDRLHFEKYMTQLLFFRRKDVEGIGDAGVLNHAIIIGVTDSGKFAGSMTLQDYISLVFPECLQAGISRSEHTDKERRPQCN